MIVEVILPYPPSANRLWRRSGKRIHKSAQYQAWLTDAAWTARSQRQGAIVGPYALSLQAKRPDKRRRDLDNLIKPVSDALTQAGVIADDCWAEMISMRWVTQGDGVHVRVQSTSTEYPEFAEGLG